MLQEVGEKHFKDMARVEVIKLTTMQYEDDKHINTIVNGMVREYNQRLEIIANICIIRRWQYGLFKTFNLIEKERQIWHERSAKRKPKATFGYFKTEYLLKMRIIP